MLTTWEQWLNWHNEGRYTTLPVIKKMNLEWQDELYAPEWLQVWQGAAEYAFVLESGKTGRYTYLGLHPDSVIYGGEQEAHTIEFLKDKQEQRINSKPLEAVRAWMQPFIGPRVSDGPKFIGGCVGFWGYDVIRTIEKLPQLAERDLHVPDYLFMRMNELWVLDHELHCVYCVVHTQVDVTMTKNQLQEHYSQAITHVEEMNHFWTACFEEEGQREKAEQEQQRKLSHIHNQSMNIDIEQLSGIHSKFNKGQFIKAVEKIQQYISQGDVFQVNLSQRLSRKVQSSPEQLYEWLRLSNPSPYMGFIKSPSFQIVSASPELLVELVDGKLATRPIAGTRRRGRTEEEEALFVQELLNDEKENAEHIMLVDLERNDLGRVSAYGTVKVKELMVIERYSHVMHLVSQIEGELAEKYDCFDVIAATFPGGTITGAPKIRTMEIIEELEPVCRGPYTGSMGWIDYNGDMEFNIIIRTMVIEQGQVHIQAGAGIVIDSEPVSEYYESLNKAKALWKAIQYSETFEI